MIVRVVVLYGNRRSICVLWCRVVSVGSSGFDLVDVDGEDEVLDVLVWRCDLVTWAYESGWGWDDVAGYSVSVVNSPFTFWAKPPGSIAVVLVAEIEDTLPGSVAIVPGGRAGVVVVDISVSIGGSTKGGLPTPAAEGTKPEIDEGGLLVKNTFVSQPGPGPAKGNLPEYHKYNSVASWRTISSANIRKAQITFLAVRPRSDKISHPARRAPPWQQRDLVVSPVEEGEFLLP